MREEKYGNEMHMLSVVVLIPRSLHEYTYPIK